VRVVSLMTTTCVTNNVLQTQLNKERFAVYTLTQWRHPQDSPMSFAVSVGMYSASNCTYTTFCLGFLEKTEKRFGVLLWSIRFMELG
jgi:hypothetical protein